MDSQTASASSANQDDKSETKFEEIFKRVDGTGPKDFGEWRCEHFNDKLRPKGLGDSITTYILSKITFPHSEWEMRVRRFKDMHLSVTFVNGCIEVEHQSRQMPVPNERKIYDYLFWDVHSTLANATNQYRSRALEMFALIDGKKYTIAMDEQEQVANAILSTLDGIHIDVKADIASEIARAIQVWSEWREGTNYDVAIGW